jgi:imipenem/basic amino acid-specific outer membrane pore
MQMHMKTLSVPALAIVVAGMQPAFAIDQTLAGDGGEQLAAGQNFSQAHTTGFFDDSTLSLEHRSYAYYVNNRNNNNAAANFAESGVARNTSQNYINEWAQAAMLRFGSGYTRGVIGFGVDAFANGAMRLNSGAGTGGSPLLPGDGGHCSAVSGTCQGQAGYGLAGGAVKVRMSQTELKAGDLMPQSPVFATWDGYLMPAHANGVMITSNEVKNLALQGGHFTSGNAENSSNRDGDLGTTYGTTRVDSADFAGADYAFNDTLSVSLHVASFEDVWRQYFLELQHTLSLDDDTSLHSRFNYYKTRDAGDAVAGDIDNDAFSITLALTHGAHTLTFAHQQVNGDTPFDYLAISGQGGNERRGGAYNGQGSIWLTNASEWADFNAPGERSYRLQYDLDASSFGIPGLTFTTRYVRGTGGDGRHADVNGAYTPYLDMQDGKEWERDAQATYVVQAGPAKDLSITLLQATYRGNRDAGINSGGDVDEVLIITSYPLDIL